MSGVARLAAVAVLLAPALAAQTPPAGRPRLVVVIGVDQLRPAARSNHAFPTIPFTSA
jgi:hypothetical protein